MNTMDRRQAIKSISAIMGYAMTHSAVAGLMSSCGSPRGVSPDWQPEFFSEKEAEIIDELSEIIIPKSDTPGAKDVQVVVYIDDLMKHIYKEKDSKKFMDGLNAVNEKVKIKYGKDLSEITTEERQQFLEAYFDMSEEDYKEKVRISWSDELPISDVDKELYYEYGFVSTLKELTVSGYFTSKLIGTEVLDYQPVPGEYQPCVDADENTRVISGW